MGLQRRNVEILQSVYDQHHQKQTGLRLERETAKLNEMVQSRGGDGATAIYHAIAKATEQPTHLVTLAIRLVWAVVFVVAGITLSRYCSEWTGRPRPKNPSQKSSQAPRRARSSTKDTQTTGEAATRYRAIRKRVREGNLKPSVRSLVSEGMTNRTAVQYLAAMAKDGIISRNGKGYHLTP